MICVTTCTIYDSRVSIEILCNNYLMQIATTYRAHTREFRTQVVVSGYTFRKSTNTNTTHDKSIHHNPRHSPSYWRSSTSECSSLMVVYWVLYLGI